MSKYIIEIAEEYEEYFKGVLICGIADGKFAVDVIAREDLEELNSDYINEHYGQMQDEAYQKGINDGSLDVKQRVEGAYQRGLEDAWEAAKKLFSSMADSDIEKAFPIEWNNGGFKALMNLQPQEAIAKLKAYEDKQKDRIEVGDEVEWDGDKYVVTYLNYDIETSEITDYDLLAYDGSVVDHVKKCTFTKTGKHYDIASILEAMRA